MKGHGQKQTISKIPPFKKAIQFPRLPKAFPEPILITFTDGAIYYVNPAWEKMTGYSFKEVYGKNPKFLKSSKTPKRTYEKLWSKLTKGKTYITDEIINLKKNGDEYQSRSVFFPIIKNAENTFYVQVLSDISEQKKSERLLKESEKHYRDLIKNASDGILLFDLDSRVIEANHTICKLLGFKKEELLGKKAFDLVDPEDLEQRAPEMQKIYEGKTTVTERTLLTKKGKKIIFELSNKMIGRNVIQTILRDITARKKAERKIIELNKTISENFNRISDGFYSLDTHWCFTYFNKAAKAMLPNKGAKLLGKNIWDVYPVLAGTELEKNFRRSMENQKNITFKAESITGKTFSVHCYPSLSGLSVYLTDITLQEEMSKRQNAFIGTASHELRNPIHSIILHTQLINNEIHKMHNNSLSKYLSSLMAEEEKLKALTNNILDTSMINSGKLNLKKEVIYLHTLINEFVEINQKLAMKHKLIIKGHLDQRVFVDKTRITQVFNNLLSNAIKYSPNANKIHILLKENQDYVTVGMKDFGIGIPKDKIKMVFNQHFRTAEGENIAQGLGLGLYISNKIITAHKGKMWVKSNYGRNSVFFFRLPVYRRNYIRGNYSKDLV